MRAAVGAVFIALLIGGSAAAQSVPQPPPDGGRVSPAEIQKLFDTYAVMQAVEQLQISDSQSPQFMAKMKALQDARRRHQQDRMRVLHELRQLTEQADKIDDAQFTRRIKALEAVDARGEDDVRQAYRAIDSILTPRQQARFRVFEEQMERRKIELLTRARANNRRAARGQSR